MRWARTVPLALVVAGLGAFIYFVERHQPTTAEREGRKDKLFATLDQAKARRIVVTNPGGRYELKREKDEWRLSSPLADAANQNTVSALLSTLTGLKSERALKASEVKLADYGLEAPALTVTVDDEAGKTFAMKLGAEASLGATRAALTDGSEIHFVSKWIAADLEKGLKDWRSDQLVQQLLANDVAAVNITYSGVRVALAHTGSAWTLTEPVADLADRERAEGLVADLAGARIKEFVDAPGPLAALGLDPRTFDVTVLRRGDKAEPLVLSFGAEREAKDGKEVACRRGDRVVWIDAKAVEKARAAAAEWRAKKLVQLDTWSVNALEVVAGAARVSLQRKDGTWQAGGTQVDYEAVQSRLNLLNELDVLAFDQPRPAGAPLGTVKVKGEGGTAVEAAFHTGPAAGRVLAVVPGRNGALAVDAAKVRDLLADPAALGKPRPVPTPAPTATTKP